MWCPFMTIARSVAADQVVSHGACMGADCALWNTRENECSLQGISSSIDRLTAAVLVASRIPPLETDKTPPP